MRAPGRRLSLVDPQGSTLWTPHTHTQPQTRQDSAKYLFPRQPMTPESALRARTLAAPPPPDTPPTPASLTPPQPLIDKTPLRQYRFPTRPSTSYIELRPTGSLSEKFIVDMKLAAGPSARRGHGSDCLGRGASLLNAFRKCATQQHGISSRDDDGVNEDGVAAHTYAMLPGTTGE